MSAPNSEIRFRAVTSADLPVIRSWMNQPHIRQWWGSPEIEIGYIEDMLDGRDTTRPFVIEVNGRSVGYIQYWFVGQHQEEPWIKDDPWLLELAYEAVGLDIFIGDSEFLSTGIGACSVRKLATQLHGKGHKALIIDPDMHNIRAIRAYEKAGFRAIPRLIGKTGNYLLMQFDPTCAIDHKLYD